MIDDWKPSYNWRYLATHPHELVFQYLRNIKWFFQRGWRGYADCDVWSIDFYLNTWMPSAIRILKKAHGYPCGLTLKEWKKILETIAVGFEAGEKLGNCPKNYKELYRKQQEGLKLFIKYYGNLWD